MLTRDDFLGVWQLVRDIDDRLGGQTGDFRGTATFHDADVAQLTYHETGQIKLGTGQAFTAQRSYQWHFEPEQVDVRFADGAAFHSFAPAGQVKGSDHPCGDDFYTASYNFTEWPLWTATWIVSGPRKNYTSVSRYIK